MMGCVVSKLLSKDAGRAAVESEGYHLNSGVSENHDDVTMRASLRSTQRIMRWQSTSVWNRPVAKRMLWRERRVDMKMA